MARFVFVTFDGGGNQPPVLAIADELRARGHTIAAAGYAAQEARFIARGLRFALLQGSQAAWEERAAGHPWRALLEGVMVCPAQLAEIPAVLAEEPHAVLVVDCMMFGALAAAERAAVPAAVLVHSAPGALLPPDGFFEREVRAPLNALRAGMGEAPLPHVRDAWLPFTVLCATLPLLDPLAGEAPATFEYVGPVFDRLPRSAWRAPWSPDDRRPLVVVSFSTNGMDQRPRIERTLAGLAHRPYRVLATTSNADVTGLSAPENAVLVPYVPHAEVLPLAAGMVTHGGHGTVTAALAHGVPLVCLPNPVIVDQIPLAKRVEALGAGRALDGDTASPTEIATAVDEVVRGTGYGDAARRLAAAIAARSGAQSAASLLERLAEHAHGLS